MTDHRVEDFLARNKEYTKTYEAPRTFAQIKSGSSSLPSLIAILCCVDGRLWPEDFFQLHKGDWPPSRYNHIPTEAQFTDIRTPVESAVVRNADGRASDAIRSLITLDSLLPLGTIFVIHHADCGLTHITDDGIRKYLKETAPEYSHEVDGMAFGEITDMTESVKEDMRELRACPYFKKDVNVLGYVFDLEKG